MQNNTSPARWPLVVLNLVSLVVALVLNTLANVVPLGGRTTGAISDSFDLRFVPAGYVFSIWGLIYLALIGFAIFQALPAQQNNPWVRATGVWFAVSSFANALWIVFWHYGYYPLSLLVMLVLLASLIIIYRRLAALGRPEGATRWLVQFPFSLYLGWISVATIANASAVLAALGWNGAPLTPVAWTVILIAVAAALSLFMLHRQRDLTYGAVIVWALIGILVKQSAFAPIVAVSTLAVAVIVLAAALLQRRPPAATARYA